LELFRRDPNDFLSRLVNLAETWLYDSEPKTTQQSMEWRQRGSPRPKNSACKNPLEMFSPRCFEINYLPKAQTINAEYYVSLLVQLKDILKEKCSGKFVKEVLFLQDIVPAHRALAIQKKLAYLVFHCLDHRPCSPDLPPSDYRLFPGL
jgi:hypothetical protein